MGQDWKPNKALSLDLFLEVLRRVEVRIAEADTLEDKNRWVVAHTYFVISYVVSLRGPEGLLLDLEATNYFWDTNLHDNEFGDYIYICLRGQVKGEHNIRCHLLPAVSVTQSGIKVMESLNRLRILKAGQGFTDGPGISSTDGAVLSSMALNDCLIEILSEIFDEDRSLFPNTIKHEEMLKENYQVYRSLRRTSDTIALENKVKAEDIDLVNRWSEVERAKGRRPNRPMKYHYADVTLLIKPFLPYTHAH